MKTIFLLAFSCCLLSASLAQPWVQNNAIFNPSGVPSLPFSQPRFADLDADGDQDMVIGSTSGSPLFLRNNGTANAPVFVTEMAVLQGVDPLDAEMGVFFDLDADGDLDLIAGGFTGLNLFVNIGTAQVPNFEKADGFFNGLNTGSLPVPAVADLDADGDGDLIAGFSESGLIRFYTNTGTATSAFFSETAAADVTDVGLYAYPTLCDLDADGDFDLVAGADGHFLQLYKNAGTPQTPLWILSEDFFGEIASTTYWNSPGFADLNGNGTLDLVFGTADGPLQYYVNTGSPEVAAWTENNSLFGGVLDPGAASNPCLVDFDDDGDLDMLSGSQLGNIYFYENTGNASNPAWTENSSFFASVDHSIYSAVAAGDIDQDGLNDIVVGDLSGKLYLHRNTGLGLEWVTTALQNVNLGGWSSPRLLDMDMDGDLDIMAGAEDGKLYYIQNNGTPQSPEWQLVPSFFGNFDAGSNCVAAPTDLDFDGDTDILCGNLFGDLKYLQNNNNSWTLNNMVMIGVTGQQNAAPFLADLDNDGDDDLVLGSYSGVFSYYRNDFLFVLVPANNHILSALDASPNPFHDQIKVLLDLQGSAKALLSIYNADGKCVKQNVLTGQNTNHEIVVSTMDWPAGCYLIRLETAETNEVIKVIKR